MSFEEIELPEEGFNEEESAEEVVEAAPSGKFDRLLGENGKKQVMEDICIKKAVDFVVANAKEAKAAKKATKKAKADEAESTEE